MGITPDKVVRSWGRSQNYLFIAESSKALAKVTVWPVAHLGIDRRANRYTYSIWLATLNFTTNISS
jgi:hypothetical protein